MTRRNTMELTFNYYDWLKALNETPEMLIFISIFGSMLFLLAFAFLRAFLNMIGLGFIGKAKFLDDFMICFGITGFFGGFLIMLLTFLTRLSEDDMSGIRLLLIWCSLFVCVFSFYITNRPALVKWYEDVTTKENITQTKSKQQKTNKKKR